MRTRLRRSKRGEQRPLVGIVHLATSLAQLAAALCFPRASGAPAYAATQLGKAAYPRGIAHAINAGGEVAGVSFDPSGTVERAVVYRGGTVVEALIGRQS